LINNATEPWNVEALSSMAKSVTHGGYRSGAGLMALGAKLQLGHGLFAKIGRDSERPSETFANTPP
jgi:hypothetical protein